MPSRRRSPFKSIVDESPPSNVGTVTASRYNPASSLLTGSAAFPGAEGPGRMATVTPTSLFFITTLSDSAIRTDLTGGLWEGSLRGWAELHPANSIAIPLVGGSIIMGGRTRLLGGAKRFGGEFSVGIGLALKMRFTGSSWHGDNCFDLFDGNNIVQGLRTLRGTGNWTVKEQGGSGIVVRTGNDNYIANSDASLNSDQSSGSSSGNLRTTWADNFFGQPINRDLHYENGVEQRHGFGPIIFGSHDHMFLRSGFFQLTQRQVLWALRNGLGHEINCLLVNCEWGPFLQAHNTAVDATYNCQVNIIKNYHIPGPISKGYDVRINRHSQVTTYLEGNRRQGVTGFRDGPEPGYYQATGEYFINGVGTSTLVNFNTADSPNPTILASRLPHAPVKEMNADQLPAFIKKWCGVSTFRNPLTGEGRDVQDSLHKYNKGWIDNPSLMPTKTLTAAPTAAESVSPTTVRPYSEVDPTIPEVGITVAQFFDNWLNPWIAREFPGATWNAVRTSNAGRESTVIQHFLDDCVFDTRA